MCPTLQPYVSHPATLCVPPCNPMCPTLQPYQYVEHLDAQVVPPVARLALALDRRAHRLPAQGDQG